MKVIGLTGSSGSGKSTVSELLKTRGFQIIDCDKIAREVLRPETNCLTDIFKTFGDEVKHTDGSLNRQALAGIVFSDPVQLQKLNDIMYPQITVDIQELLAGYEQQAVPWVVLDAPTLFESGADAMCDFTVSVLADDRSRLARIMERDQLTQNMAENRLKSQQTNDYYRKKSDFVIENTAGMPELIQQVEQLTVRIMR